MKGLILCLVQLLQILEKEDVGLNITDPALIIGDLHGDIVSLIIAVTRFINIKANNPDLKLVLEQGYSAVPDEWIDGLSDKSPSGIDMKVTGTLCHWLYRYGKNAIITLLEESAICRNEKNEKNKAYLINTVNKAYDSKEKFFYAVDFQKLNNKQKQEYKKLTEAIKDKS